MIQRRQRKKTRLRRRGVAAVEFAVVAPAMFLILFACFELVRVQMIRGMANVASYEAARHVMVPGAKIEEATFVARQKLNGLAAFGPDVISVSVVGKDGPQTEINDNTTSVTVEIDIPISDTTFLLGLFYANNNIRSRTTLTFESYDGFYDGSSF